MKLYHGILQKNKLKMLTNGVYPQSYWGEKEVALKYTDCNQIIEIDSNDFIILPNETIIEHYTDQDPGDETYIQWLNSNQTWEDSLEIFGSVIIEDSVNFSEDQILSDF